MSSEQVLWSVSGLIMSRQQSIAGTVLKGDWIRRVERIHIQQGNAYDIVGPFVPALGRVPAGSFVCLGIRLATYTEYIGFMVQEGGAETYQIPGREEPVQVRNGVDLQEVVRVDVLDIVHVYPALAAVYHKPFGPVQARLWWALQHRHELARSTTIHHEQPHVRMFNFDA